MVTKQKNILISFFKKIPHGCLLGVCLFFFTQGILPYSPFFSSKTYALSRPVSDVIFRFDAGLRLIPDKSPAQKRVILFGGSFTNEGFDANYLNESFSSSNIEFHKMCIIIATPADLYQIKKKVVEAKPDVVVLTFGIGHFYISDNGFFALNYFFPYDLAWRSLFDYNLLPYYTKHFGVKKIIEDRDVFFDGLTAKMILARRYRETFSYLIDTAIENVIIPQENKFGEYYFNDPFWKKIPKKAYEDWWPDLEKRLAGNQTTIYERTKLTAFNEELFGRLIEYFIDNGIKVIVTDSPIFSPAKKYYDSNLDILYKNFMSDQSQRLGFLYLSQNYFPLFVGSDFIYDPIHLNKSGRGKMTEVLKEYLENNFSKIFE